MIVNQWPLSQYVACFLSIIPAMCGPKIIEYV